MTRVASESRNLSESTRVSDVRRRLLAWYRDNARDLPWRRTKDPYAIWVSEIMCQQTRVDTVIPYYHRFLDRFPTTHALAAADEDEVLAFWSGLGYYRRARLLHRGVKEVVAQYGGEVPQDAGERLDLPGVGRYTAGAIGSIAFSKEEPIVDGNVSRVLCRMHRIATPLGARTTDAELWRHAGELVRGEDPGDLNQALMELGATVCSPTQPKCLLCPVRDACEAHAHDEIDKLPVPRARKAPKEVELVAVVPVRGRGAKREVWLERGSRQLFGGMWSVPTGEVGGSGASEKEIDALLREARIRGNVTRSRGKVHHVLTHRRLTVHVYLANGSRAVNGTKGTPAAPRSKEAAAAQDAKGRFFRFDELQSVGVSKLTMKILTLAFGEGSAAAVSGDLVQRSHPA